MMDPFKSDEEDDDVRHPSAAQQPRHPQTALSDDHASSEGTADPFALDQSEVKPQQEVVSDEHREIHLRKGRPTESSRPSNRLDPATASHLLGSSEAGPSTPRPREDHIALKMQDAAEGAGSSRRPSQSSAEDEEEENIEAGEADRLVRSRHTDRPTLQSPASASASSRSQRSNERRANATKSSSRGIRATLSALGRRIARAASQAEQEDAQARNGSALGPLRLGGAGTGSRGDASSRRLEDREKALWMWANVDNIDEFLREVYAYYTGKGLVCIALSKALNLLTIAFVIGFSTFLFGCIDYSRITHDGKLADIVVSQCMARFSVTSILLITAFGIAYGLQLVRFGFGLRRLKTMRHFFEHLLGIPDEDIQTIQWHLVVARLSDLLSARPLACIAASIEDDSPQSIDVHEVANRLMRQENFLIALLNRNLVDFRLPGQLSGQPLLTKSLQWNLDFCLLGYLFDQEGNVRKPFLSDKYREDLIDGLRRRLFFMAIMNAVFAPFIICYLAAYSFFRYFEEYHKNPAYLGSRQYTELARWKFREYNELPHLFRRRLHSSYPYAERYVQQFPKERTAIIARFVSFIAGSFVAVLILASVLDPDVFVHFEITPQRNTLFYIGVFTAILAASRAAVPDERLVFEPEVLLQAVVHHTHYCPPEWKGRFHSSEVNADFASLYKLKLSIFVTELLSVIVTPFILCLSLPKSAPSIVDFFREYTIHVDRLGYVCSLAVFDFTKQRPPQASTSEDEEPHELASEGSTGNVNQREVPGRPQPQSTRIRAQRSAPRLDDKLEQSVLHFAAANAWRPGNPESTMFLSKLQEQHDRKQRRQMFRRRPRHQTSGDYDDDDGGLAEPTASVLAAREGDDVDSMLLAERSRLYERAFDRSMQMQHQQRQQRQKRPKQIPPTKQHAGPRESGRTTVHDQRFPGGRGGKLESVNDHGDEGSDDDGHSVHGRPRILVEDDQDSFADPMGSPRGNGQRGPKGSGGDSNPEMSATGGGASATSADFDFARSRPKGLVQHVNRLIS